MWSCGCNAHLNGANLQVDVWERLFLNWVANIFLVFRVQNVSIQSFKVLFIYVSPKLKWIETILLKLGNE